MKHNGGKSQINLAFDGHFAYLDLMRTAQTWALGDWESVPSPDLLDANGYPKTFSPIGVASVIGLPTYAARPGNYVCRWIGEGTVDGHFNPSVVSGSRSGVNGRFVFSTRNWSPNAAGQLSTVVRIHSVNPQNRITKLEIFHEEDEQRLDSGALFGIDFLRRMREANFGVIRFMDWQHTNESMVAHWSDLPGPMHYSTLATVQSPSLYAGRTKSQGNNYGVDLPGFQLVDKARVSLTWDADADGPVTLNVSGTGDIPVRTMETFALNSATMPRAGRPAYLVYDADLDIWIKRAGDSSNKSAGPSSTPVEFMVRLANELGAHPWFCIPHLALDPLTDFARDLAEYVRDHLYPSLVPRFEPSNEVWNTAPGFAQTHYAIAKANARWGSGLSRREHDRFQHAYNNWYGMVLSRLGETVESVYQGNRNRYQVVGAIQSAAAESQAPRFEAPLWVAEKPGVNRPAQAVATHLAIANYWNSTYSAQDELDAAYAFATADSATQKRLAAAYVAKDQYSSKGNAVFNIARVVSIAQLRRDFAQSIALSLTFYEGGWSPDYPMSGANYVDYDVRLTAITKARQAVVTVHGTSIPLPPLGAMVSFHDVADMTQLNGNTYTVVARDLDKRQFTIDVDSTAFGTFLVPAADLRNVVYRDSGRYRTALRQASKHADPLEVLTISMYRQLERFGSNPAHLSFGGAANAWSLWDPNIYATPTPQWRAIVRWNRPRVQSTYTIPYRRS